MAGNRDPSNIMYMNNLADAHRLKGELDQALKILKKSLKLNPRGMGTHFNLGMVYKDLKDQKNAINSFKKSLEINPILNEAHFQIAQIELSMKKVDSALKSIESAIQFDPSKLKYKEFHEKILALKK